MILTGNEIYKEVKNGNVVIEPFSAENLDQNSYAFHIGNEIIEYDSDRQRILDAKKEIVYKKIKIPEEGYILKPGKFYLASTYEKMGSNIYAKSLLANFSTSSCGMWIQFSAPLGHMGAIINWTLEIMVAQEMVVYPYMRIGKLAFWDTLGEREYYSGKYVGSDGVVSSRIQEDFT